MEGPKLNAKLCLFFSQKDDKPYSGSGLSYFKANSLCPAVFVVCVCVAFTRVSVTHNVLIKGNISYVYMSISWIYRYI